MLNTALCVAKKFCMYTVEALKEWGRCWHDIGARATARRLERGVECQAQWSVVERDEKGERVKHCLSTVSVEGPPLFCPLCFCVAVLNVLLNPAILPEHPGEHYRAEP